LKPVWQRPVRWCCQQTVAFTPKGGCPLKPSLLVASAVGTLRHVAFTPKGGCPLKLNLFGASVINQFTGSSIHPQGWVPIETRTGAHGTETKSSVAFTPKGGCPLKPHASDRLL